MMSDRDGKDRASARLLVWESRPYWAVKWRRAARPLQIQLGEVRFQSALSEALLEFPRSLVLVEFPMAGVQAGVPSGGSLSAAAGEQSDGDDRGRVGFRPRVLEPAVVVAELPRFLASLILHQRRHPEVTWAVATEHCDPALPGVMRQYGAEFVVTDHPSLVKFCKLASRHASWRGYDMTDRPEPDPIWQSLPWPQYSSSEVKGKGPHD